MLSLKARADLIRQTAAELGIDPNIALRVARSEGHKGGVWQSQINGEPSFGDFQLLLGDGKRWPKGLGNDFMRKTGLDPRDPENAGEMIKFALQHAARHGWGAWYGAKNVGIGDWDGIKRPGRGETRPTAGIDVAPSLRSKDTPSTTFTDKIDAELVEPEEPEMLGDPEEGYENEPEMDDYPDYPEDEGDYDIAGASEALTETGKNMMAGDEEENFDYQPAGPSDMPMYAVDEGIPTNAYQQYTAYAQEGGEIEEVDFDPSQYEFGDNEIEPGEFLANFVGAEEA